MYLRQDGTGPAMGNGSNCNIAENKEKRNNLGEIAFIEMSLALCA